MTAATNDPFPDLPADPPSGLTTTPAGSARWWRFDRTDARIWDWTPYPVPLHRFDPPSARFRVRYAAATLHGAVLERFESYGRRRATHADTDTSVVRLAGDSLTLDLTDVDVREALHVDERISVGRSVPTRPDAEDPLLDACGLVADRVHDWFGIPATTILFRSRHDAERRNLAFSSATLTIDGIPERIDRSRNAITALLAAGVSVPDSWLDNLS